MLQSTRQPDRLEFHGCMSGAPSHEAKWRPIAVEERVAEIIEERVAEAVEERVAEAVEERVAEEIKERVAEVRKEGIRVLIADNMDEGFPMDKILGKLKKRFGLTASEAQDYLEQFTAANGVSV